MRVINWLEIKTTDLDWNKATQNLVGVVHIRTLVQALVRSAIQNYPWNNRTDLVPLFDPSCTYRVNDFVAFPQKDPQGLRPDSWRIGLVNSIAHAENPLQGEFQVVTIEAAGRKQTYAANIPDARPIKFIFPLHDATDLDWLVSDITDAYLHSIVEVIRLAIQSGRLNAIVYEEYILLGDVYEECGEEEKQLLSGILTFLSVNKPWITCGEILHELRNKGFLLDIPDNTASFILTHWLNKIGYHSLGEDLWTTSQMLEQIDRPIDRRIDVPRLRSIVIQQLGVSNDEELLDSDKNDMDEKALVALGELMGVHEVLPLEPDHTWLPPSSPIPMPTFNYLHIREGYFPLSSSLSKAFDPAHDPSLVFIQVIDGAPIPFRVSSQEGVIAAIELEKFQEKFRHENNIPAGTRLWLEYHNASLYRIAPHPLPSPLPLRCKTIFLDDKRQLVIEEQDIPVYFEHDANLFRAALRFEDMDALFAEADQLGWSIFDTIYYTFESLASQNPNMQLHHTQVFNIVFFRHRMCSPNTIIAELYDRSCFVPVGNGYFRFDPTLGFKKKAYSKKKMRPSLPSVIPLPQLLTESTRYFIFQQRDKPEYADQPGKIYNWRQGIPGANQITVGSRFVYYRTVEKVFFGSGRIDRIETYQNEQGETCYNGYITGYERWQPVIPLTIQLAQHLEFVSSDRLWIGQAGIRQINQQDYETLLQAYQEIQANVKGKTIEVEIDTRITSYQHTFSRLQPLINAYRQDPGRPNVLFCRQIAHQRIRESLTLENLKKLTLDQFNQNIWQLGSVIDRGRVIPLLSQDWYPYMRQTSVEDLKRDLQVGNILLTGNQTWGSATHVIGAMLGLTDLELERVVRKTLHDLLYSTGSIQERIKLVLDEPNGYGINVVTGILHAMYPNDHILYNRRSVQALQKLAIPWTKNWQTVQSYFSYRDRCLELRDYFGFGSLSDVDWFMYCVDVEHISIDAVPSRESSKVSDAKSPDSTSPISSDQQSPTRATYFWDQVASLSGRQLITLDQKRPFKILRLTPNTLEIKTSTGHTRNIDRYRIEDSWNRLVSTKILHRTEICDQFSDFNPAYIAAILAAMPGVTYKIRPIQLTYQPEEEIAIVEGRA